MARRQPVAKSQPPAALIIADAQYRLVPRASGQSPSARRSMRDRRREAWCGLREWPDSRDQDRADQPGSVLGEVAYEVGRLDGKLRDEDLESERRLLAGEERPHAPLRRLGEVGPVSRREAGLAE